jgi:hypothetical protein
LGKGRRRSRYDQEGPNRTTVALFVGALVLLLASGGLIAAMLRQGSALQAASPTPGGTTLAVASPSPASAATPPATNTPPAPTPLPATATGTTRPPTATARPATPATPASPRPSSPTPVAGTTQARGCALAIPAGFTEEREGYYPADDDTGFIGLDPFDTNGGQRSTADLAQGFIEGTLKRTLQDFRQTASVRTDGESRIEYTASAGGKAGRGVVVVRQFGDIACGVTLFILDDSPIPYDQTLDYLLSSLQPSRP